MKRLWKQYTEKMDGASLRERAMIFAAAATLLIAALNFALIEPELVKQRRLSREVAQRQGEIKLMQEQIQAIALTRKADPDREMRVRSEALRRQIAELESKLAEEQRRFAPSAQVGALLEEMLSRNRRLMLVDMRTLPAATLGGEGGEAPKPAAQKPAAAKPAAPVPRGQIYRHGVEITVSGTYLDLLAYLKDLEKLPNQMYWGKLELAVSAHPQVTMKLSVYTLSLDLAWLVV
ncbi:MAG: agglutinin biogenesis protein [Betaproteobacteria bacterium]|nr:agglutinin biogenesis protein [Betaproteobacteria bacterium]